MDFIAETLDLFPEPAALYDGDFHLVGANAAAWEWVLNDLPDAFTDRDEWRARSGVGEALERARDEGEYAVALDWGLLQVTRLPGELELARPDLLLATLRAGTNDVDDRRARIDHRSLALALRVNETGQSVMAAMETVTIQVQAAFAAQAKMIATFNDAIRDLFSDTPKKDTPRA